MTLSVIVVDHKSVSLVVAEIWPITGSYKAIQSCIRGENVFVLFFAFVFSFHFEIFVTVIMVKCDLNSLATLEGSRRPYRAQLCTLGRSMDYSLLHGRSRSPL